MVRKGENGNGIHLGHVEVDGHFFQDEGETEGLKVLAWEFWCSGTSCCWSSGSFSSKSPPREMRLEMENGKVEDEY